MKIILHSLLLTYFFVVFSVVFVKEISKKLDLILSFWVDLLVNFSDFALVVLVEFFVFLPLGFCAEDMIKVTRTVRKTSFEISRERLKIRANISDGISVIVAKIE